MKNFKFNIAILLFVTGIVYAQVQQEWAKIFDGQLHYYDDPSGIVCDNNGNVYVGGTSAGNGGDRSSVYEYVTFKYDLSGQLMWLNRYNGDPNLEDWLIDVQIDYNSNVYVTGMSFITQQQTYDWATIKYNANGVQQWLSIFGTIPGYNMENPKVMKLDMNSNVYIAGGGGTPITHADIELIKYNSNGQLLWQTSFNRADSSNDVPEDLVIDNSGNIYIAGTSQDHRYIGWGSTDAVLLKYNPNGVLLWSKIYNSPNDTFDNAASVITDNSGNAIMSGYTTGVNQTSEIFIAKYSPGGQQLWVKTFNGPKGYDYNMNDDLFTDSLGNIYNSNTVYNTANGNDDISLIKMNPQGTVIFSKTYNSSANKFDFTNNAVKDKFNSIYILGTVDMGVNNGSRDIILLKYNPSGELIWNINYSGAGAMYYNDDKGKSLCIDSSYNIFVTGESENGTFSTDIVTIKYSQVIGIQPISNEIPESYKLSQNYPNPFNPVTMIKFSLPVGNGRDRSVKLIIYDILGQEITTLINEQLQPGVYEVEWDGTNFASGVYFYKLTVNPSDPEHSGSNGYVETKKMVLLR